METKAAFEEGVGKVGFEVDGFDEVANSLGRIYRMPLFLFHA